MDVFINAKVGSGGGSTGTRENAGFTRLYFQHNPEMSQYTAMAWCCAQPWTRKGDLISIAILKY